MKTKKPVRIHSKTYEVKGWNEKSRPIPKKDHPWKVRNNAVKEFIHFRKDL